MAFNHDKLFNPNEVEIKDDVSEIDTIIEFEEVLLAISEKIIEYRKEHNISQKQLAEILKVNQSMISKLESGDYNATFKNIYNISRKLEDSSYMFLEVLNNIINKLTKLKINSYKTKILDKPLNYSKKTNNSKLIEFKYYTKNSTKGGKINYGRYTSSISNVG